MEYGVWGNSPRAPVACHRSSEALSIYKHNTNECLLFRRVVHASTFKAVRVADIVAILFGEFVVGYFPALKPAAPKRERFVDGHTNSLFVGHAYSRRVASLDMDIN